MIHFTTTDTVSHLSFVRGEPAGDQGLSEQDLQDTVYALQGRQQGRGFLPGHPDPVFFREQTGQVVDGPPDVQVIVHAGPEQGLELSRRL